MRLVQRLFRKVSKNIGVKSFISEDFSLDRIILNFIGNEKPVEILDVGANYGQSIERFRGYLNVSKIHCFEPQPDAMLVLKEKYLNDPVVILNQLGLSNKRGKLRLNQTLKSGTSSFKAYNNESPYVESKMKAHRVGTVKELIKSEIEVSVDTLDNYINQNEIFDVDVLKIDVEGFEKFVVAGASESIKRRLFKFIEIELTLDDRFGESGNFFDIEQYIVPHGYKICAFDDQYSIVERPIFHFNVLYIRENVLQRE